MGFFTRMLPDRLRRKAAGAGMVTDVSALQSGWFGILREGFSGAWQRNIVVETSENLLAFSAVYACVDLIANDISKLRIKLVEFTQGVWIETSSPAFSPVLRKPNPYQTRVQFLHYWMVSKLLWGNTYAYKQRDQRGIVVALFILDPRMVQTKVTSDGAVYYQIAADYLSRTGSVTVPASEVIHDRAMCPYNPLVGVGPLYAAGVSATQGRKIQVNSSKFFENMSRPSGHLTADGNIPDETAKRLKDDFEERFAGQNIGSLLVTGSGLKYEPLTMPAEQAQLIQQLGWTGEDCCRPFHVPAYKVGLGAPPTFNNIGQMNQDYYSQCLQTHIEAIEILLDEGLGLDIPKDGKQLGTELDVESLLRMDPMGRAEVAAKGMGAGWISPDEARGPEGMLPLPGGAGAQPFMQQQNYPVSVLAKRTDVTPTAAPAPAASSAPDAAAKAAANLIEAASAVRAQIESAAAAELASQERSHAVAAAQAESFDRLADEVRAKLENLQQAKAEDHEAGGIDEEFARLLISKFTLATYAERETA